MAPHKLRGSGALSGGGRGGAHTAGGVPGGVGIVSCNIIFYIYKALSQQTNTLLVVAIKLNQLKPLNIIGNGIFSVSSDKSVVSCFLLL